MLISAWYVLIHHSFFWMAQARPMNRQSNRVVFKAAAGNPNWDIKKGDEVLNITWLERVDAEQYPRKFCSGLSQTIALKSALPRKVAQWESESTNRKYLARSDEQDFIEMCRTVVEDRPHWTLHAHFGKLMAKHKAQ